MRAIVLSSLALLWGGAAWATQPPYTRVVQVKPSIETPNLPDNAFESDGDDPAIWIHPTKQRQSLVVTAVKDGGVRVYDLDGKPLQTIDPVVRADGVGRINNVDVAYGLRLPGGGSIDVALGSDRALDVIRIWRIDPGEASPLTEVTADPDLSAFPQRPKTTSPGLEDNPVEDQNTAYGLALWRDRDAHRLFAVVTQRGEPRLGLFRLRARADSKVAVLFVHDWVFPDTHDGQDLRRKTRTTPCATGARNSKG